MGLTTRLYGIAIITIDHEIEWYDFFDVLQHWSVLQETFNLMAITVELFSLLFNWHIQSSPKLLIKHGMRNL